VLIHVFDAALRLLHPVVPFVTEALWQRLPHAGAGAVLARAAWPAARTARDTDDPTVGRAGRRPVAGGADFEFVREAVSAVRQIRADYGIGRGTMLDVIIEPTSSAGAALTDEAAAIGRMTGSQVRIASERRADLTATPGAGRTEATGVLSDGSTVLVPLAGVVDLTQECERLTAELAQLDQELSKLQARLATPQFIERAPRHVVDAERAREQERTARADQLRTRIRAVCGG
jgi:valyl-tRNA synthetase